jgi:hypothetical protein
MSGIPEKYPAAPLDNLRITSIIVSLQHEPLSSFPAAHFFSEIIIKRALYSAGLEKHYLSGNLNRHRGAAEDANVNAEVLNLTEE